MMQRGEFLSHEPSTFTFQTSFLCPTRRETTSGRITGFQNFTRVHKYRSIPYEKKIFESIACSSIANECIFRFHVLHIHWKIKNFRLRVFIKKTLAQILWGSQSFNNKPSSINDSEKLKLNLHSNLFRKSWNRAKGTHPRTRSTSSSQGPRVAQCERGEETRNSYVSRATCSALSSSSTAETFDPERGVAAERLEYEEAVNITPFQRPVKRPRTAEQK